MGQTGDGLTKEDTQDTEGFIGLSSASSVSSVVENWVLAPFLNRHHDRELRLFPELHGDARACRDVGSGGGGLLAGDATAYGIQLQTDVLSGFYRSANRLAHKRWHFDSALLYV